MIVAFKVLRQYFLLNLEIQHSDVIPVGAGVFYLCKQIHIVNVINKYFLEFFDC